ncbi:MAG: hypothetical protein PVF75_03885 [Granulosicoccaceae bacterium]|jgi:hypothetical protein
MPYFVFHKTEKKLELQSRHDSYRDAKQEVKALRQANPDEDINNFRLVYADNEKQGRILLTTKRESSPIEEWEV